MELISTETESTDKAPLQRHLTSRLYRRIALSPGAPLLLLGLGVLVKLKPRPILNRLYFVTNIQVCATQLVNNDTLISESLQSSEYPHFSFVLFDELFFRANVSFHSPAIKFTYATLRIDERSRCFETARPSRDGKRANITPALS